MLFARNVVNIIKRESSIQDISGGQKVNSLVGSRRSNVLAVCNHRGQLICGSPTPGSGQAWQIRRIGSCRLSVLSFPTLRRLFFGGRELGELVGFPLLAALDEDAFEELRGGFSVGMFGAPDFGELAFDGG